MGKNKESQILNLLKSAGEKGVTNQELSKVALRYGGYLGELYKKGYRIDKEHLGDNLYKYIFVSEPDVVFTLRKSAKSILLENVENEGICSKEALENLIESLGLSIRYKAGTHTNN